MALANGIFEAGYKEMMKASEACAPPPATPAPRLPNAAYLGDYRNGYVGDARVVDSGDGLFLVLGPAGNRRLPLTPFNRDLFVYSPAAETPQSRMGRDLPDWRRHDRGPRRIWPGHHPRRQSLGRAGDRRLGRKEAS